MKTLKQQLQEKKYDLVTSIEGCGNWEDGGNRICKIKVDETLTIFKEWLTQKLKDPKFLSHNATNFLDVKARKKLLEQLLEDLDHE